jgi:glycosyltransferase involved in cell wall biosynthesis
MPRILYTTADASPQSGAFRSLLSMSQGIVARGYDPILALHSEARETSLLAFEGLKRAYFLDLPRARRGQRPGYWLRYAIQGTRSVYDLTRLIRKDRIALVHINEILDLYGGLAARIAGIPTVWHVRSDFSTMPALRYLLTTLVLRLATAVVAVSGSVRERMFRDLGKDRVTVVHDPGPDLSRFHPGIDGSPVRGELGIPDNALVVTLVAKLSERKGHRTLISAIPQVLATCPRAHFLLVGGELQGERYNAYARELRALTSQAAIVKHVTFTGFRTDIPQIMAASDVVTHCSVYPDPFPGVVLQGMAVGKPVIASKIGGPLEQIDDGISGVLVEPGDADALAREIVLLLSADERRNWMGHRAVERVRAAFTPECFFHALSCLYERLLGRAELKPG